MGFPTSANAALIREYTDWLAERDARKVEHAKSEEAYRKAAQRSEGTAKALFAADDRLDALRDAMRALGVPLPVHTDGSQA